MSRNRSPESRARQQRSLIRDALAVVGALSDSRLAQLGEASGLSPAAALADLQRFATERPRCVLTAFAKEARAAARVEGMPA